MRKLISLMLIVSLLLIPVVVWGAYGERINTGDEEIIYHFEGDCADSGISADDTCTPTSTAYTQSGYFGQGIQFDKDTNDYVTVPYTNIEGFNSGTIEFWFKTVDAGTTYLDLFTISDGDSTQDYVIFRSNTTNNLHFFIKRDTVMRLYFKIPDNGLDQQWHYVAIVTGSGYNWICFDGTFPTVSFTTGSSATAEFSNINTPSDSYIGRLQYDSIAYYNMDGIVDEFVIYPGKTFTKDEILDRYNMQKSSYGIHTQ